MLLTQTGNEVGGKLSSQFLEEALKSVPSATSATALNKLKPLLEALMPTIEQRAGAIITERSKQAIVTSSAHYDNELSRLSHLQALNPLIRDDEIADLSEQKSACHAALSQTKAVLEGLRVCIAVN
jgi:ATP-dependent helicase HepA